MTQYEYLRAECEKDYEASEDFWLDFCNWLAERSAYEGAAKAPVAKTITLAAMVDAFRGSRDYDDAVEALVDKAMPDAWEELIMFLRGGAR